MTMSTRFSRSVKPLESGRTAIGLALLAILLLARPAAALATAEESQRSLQPEGASDLQMREGRTWLETRGSGSELGRSRVRRFVPFPASSLLETTFKLNFPVTGTIGLNTIVLATVFVFKLPTEYFSIGRSYQNTAADERAFLYSNIESILDGFGYDGRACTLRTLCEIAESPFEHDLYGELINLVLSASKSPNNSVEYDDYMLAEHYGSTYGDCASIYHTCPSSVLDIISHSI
ncbi:hypothetical protein GWK47_011913 [Chionoecetes opilio]|uniref:Uncharacterized protein n=1 Tax=Chionoecetes opilio TaxID=41210 RepID=A0A8J4Y5W6_CHIOP|nr:hypothetical protein GWK47_011913 [Chionoecetes opilio]